MSGFFIYDLLAVGMFLVGWTGFTYAAEHGASAAGNLIGGMALRRADWMRRMLHRDNRMLDIQVVRSLQVSNRFFASTSILIIVGLLAVLGSTDRAIALVMDLPFTFVTTRQAWEAKVLGMVLVFIYAFFKSVWSMRQYNYCAILIGAAPSAAELPEDEEAIAAPIARLATLAAKHANRGIRAYYFGLASLAWFVHPLLTIPTVLWVVLVLYRREFRSRTHRLISEYGVPS